jgi:serine/threonine-protein kinase
MPILATERTTSANSQRFAQARPAASSPLSHYELLSLAGRGTFAEVWQVRDPQTGQVYALKQLRPEWVERPAARQLLRNEAEVGSKVSSEYVARVQDSELETSSPYILLEWLSGQTLEAHLPRGQRLPGHDALWVARQVAQAMHSLLVAGHTHGDIKPSNIFICNDGTAKLIDLGFARPDQMLDLDFSNSSHEPLTGTPEYLAPEALLPGHPGGIARDVYSLGITLYRMLTGVLPFQGETIADILQQQQQSMPTRLRSLAPDVPREVADFVHRLLAKAPLRRGNGLSWLIHELIGLELLLLEAISA